MKMKTETQFPREHREPEGASIRTFLADDNPFTLAMVARLLTKDPRIEIVGSAADGRKAFYSAASLAPDLVLTDLHMPATDGLELTRRLKQLQNPPVVFVMTSDNSPEALLRSLGAGADEFLVKGKDFPLQLQMAMANFFPIDRAPERRSNIQFHELISTSHDRRLSVN